MTLVTAKNRCSGTRKVPLKKNNPTATAAAIPTIVPIQVCSPSLESSTARKISASSAPSRNTIRKTRSEEHTSELQSLAYLVCRLLLEKKKNRSTALRKRWRSAVTTARLHTPCAS